MARQTLADRHRQAQQMLTLQASNHLVRLWQNVDPSDIVRSWQAEVPYAAQAISGLQVQAARDAEQYMATALADAGSGPRGPRVRHAGFAGFAYPLAAQRQAMPLGFALQSPAYKTLNFIGKGVAPERAMASGLDMLIKHGTTAVADAGRQADGVIVATEPQVTGYVRRVEPTACSRCIILAGRRYARSAGFDRHPLCMCEHDPIVLGGVMPEIQDPYEAFFAMTEEEQNHRWGEANAQAIRDGADIFQVTNARRGMYTTAQGQRFTTEGVGRTRGGRRLGNAGHAMDQAGYQGARLLPEQIYENARRYGGGRERILEDLRGYGYITGDRDPMGALNPQMSGWYGPAAGYQRRAMTYDQALENELLGRYSWNPNR